MALWIVLYFLVGLVLMCLIQYWKGRGIHSRSVDITRDLELDLLSAAVFAIWPGVIMLGVATGLLMLIALPVIKLSAFCTKLGKKHRGTE
jgi:hypothetical protein